MAKISAKQMQSRLQQVANQRWLENQVHEIILSDQDKLKERKVNEFTRGQRPDGERIGEYRNAEYGIFKAQINPLANGYVDLLLTRSFTRKMFLRKFGQGYLFNSSDNKTGNLIGKYGIDIMGINQEWFNERQKNIYKYILLFDISKILNKK